MTLSSLFPPHHPNPQPQTNSSLWPKTQRAGVKCFWQLTLRKKKRWLSSLRLWERERPGRQLGNRHHFRAYESSATGNVFSRLSATTVMIILFFPDIGQATKAGRGKGVAPPLFYYYKNTTNVCMHLSKSSTRTLKALPSELRMQHNPWRRQKSVSYSSPQTMGQTGGMGP